MRKVVLFNMVTLDGMFEGPGQNIDWHNVDDEFNEFAIAQTPTFGTIIFGRVTYEGMASWWPTRMALDTDPEVAAIMNSAPKVVFSHTLEKADWNNTRIIRDNLEQEVEKLKQEPGGDIAIFGSGDLATSFVNADLIDEYRLMFNPLILSAGTPLFKNINHTIKLKLVNSRVFQNGNVLLYYQPVREQ